WRAQRPPYCRWRNSPLETPLKAGMGACSYGAQSCASSMRRATRGSRSTVMARGPLPLRSGASHGPLEEPNVTKTEPDRGETASFAADSLVLAAGICHVRHRTALLSQLMPATRALLLSRRG